MRPSHLLLPVLFVLALAPDVLAAPSPYTLWPTAQTLDDAPLLAKKSKKKKKKKSDEGDDFGPADIDAIDHNDNSGVGVHREQEGVDRPYSAEANMSTDLSLLTITPDGGDAISATTINIAVEWLFILGQMEIGPDIAYQSATSAATATSTDIEGNVTTESVESTNSGYSVGGTFKWNFGNIDHDDLVIFAYGGIALQASEYKVGDGDASKSSGTIIKAGGGANLFIDSNIAFNPRAEFRMESDKPEAEGAGETSTTGLKILVGIAVFL